MRLDLRGLNCPLPALRTRKLLRRLAQGDCLIVECTDPLSIIDIPHLLRETGDRLITKQQIASLTFTSSAETHESYSSR